MAVLEFKASEVARIVRHAFEASEHRSTYGQPKNPGPHLWLVGDQGVYLMSNGFPSDNVGETNTKLFVSFAKGCNPETDDFETWYNNKVDWFGADDGCDALDWCEAIGQQLINGAKTIRISIVENSLTLLDPKWETGMSARFILYRDNAGEFRWKLLSKNDAIILVSEGFEQKKSALRCIEVVRACAPIDDLFERRETLRGEFCLSLRSRNGNVIGVLGFYRTPAAINSAMREIQVASQTEVVDDCT